MSFNQKNVWDREYQKPKLVTKGDKVQSDVLAFLKFLKKEEQYLLENKNILDLGCGTGKNTNYLQSLNNNLVGIDISKVALDIARERAKKLNLSTEYILGDIAKDFDFGDSHFDIALDVTSSNSLDEAGRDKYLKEVNRVLKKGAYFFVRALSKDANKNVKNLLKMSPGKEKDTYIIKEMGLQERVFSRIDFVKLYSQYFEILRLKKKTNYTTFNNRIYKRDYIIAYLKK